MLSMISSHGRSVHMPFPTQMQPLVQPERQGAWTNNITNQSAVYPVVHPQNEVTRTPIGRYLQHHHQQNLDKLFMQRLHDEARQTCALQQKIIVSGTSLVASNLDLYNSLRRNQQDCERLPQPAEAHNLPDHKMSCNEQQMLVHAEHRSQALFERHHNRQEQNQYRQHQQYSHQQIQHPCSGTKTGVITLPGRRMLSPAVPIPVRLVPGHAASAATSLCTTPTEMSFSLSSSPSPQHGPRIASVKHEHFLTPPPLADTAEQHWWMTQTQHNPPPPFTPALPFLPPGPQRIFYGLAEPHTRTRFYPYLAPPMTPLCGDVSFLDRPPPRRCRRCRCPNCLKSLSNPCSSSEKRRMHVCHYPGCGKEYGKTSHLKAHLRGHAGERPFICRWLYCQKRFTRSDELQRHLRTHTGEKNFQCRDCGKRFMRSDHLNKHAKTHEIKKDRQNEDESEDESKNLRREFRESKATCDRAAHADCTSDEDFDDNCDEDIDVGYNEFPDFFAHCRSSSTEQMSDLDPVDDTTNDTHDHHDAGNIYNMHSVEFSSTFVHSAGSGCHMLSSSVPFHVTDIPSIPCHMTGIPNIPCHVTDIPNIPCHVTDISKCDTNTPANAGKTIMVDKENKPKSSYVKCLST